MPQLQPMQIDPGLLLEQYQCRISKASEDYKRYQFQDGKTGENIYLMQAEVINELNGDRSAAFEYINKVRRRSGMADLDAAGFTTYTALLDQIKHERLVELQEDAAWYDLSR